MLMVLMALLELGRTKVGKATRWLWMLLSGGLWLAQPACDIPQAMYGVPADFQQGRDVPDDAVDDAVPGDVPSVDVPVLPDVPADCGAMAYYGPQPCDTDTECVQREGPGWYCDTANVFTDPCGQQVNWPYCRPGDVPLDAVTPDVPVDAPPDCQPVVAYGPPPCTSDESCQVYGTEWICDKEHPVTDPCTGNSWYVCGERPVPSDVIPSDARVDVVPPDAPVDAPPDCPPMGWYGPPPCTSDEDCVQDYGPGWVCNKDAPVPDGCGGPATYPVCETTS
jgi:hypothetical protein